MVLRTQRVDDAHLMLRGNAREDVNFINLTLQRFFGHRVHIRASTHLMPRAHQADALCDRLSSIGVVTRDHDRANTRSDRFH